MGYGMGKLEVIEHDGQGHLSFEERPFVVMKDRAFVDLGTVEKAEQADRDGLGSSNSVSLSVPDALST